MGIFWSEATQVFSTVACRMTRVLKTVSGRNFAHFQQISSGRKNAEFHLFSSGWKNGENHLFPSRWKFGPYGQKNGGGIVVIPPPRALRRAYAVSCRETKNPNPLPTANRFGFFDFGGDKRDRTADLLNAIQALSQIMILMPHCYAGA